MDSVCFMDIWDMRMNLKALMRRIRNPILFAILPDIQRPHIWMSWLCHKDERNEIETNRRKERIINMNKGIVTPQKGLRKRENAILRVFAAHVAEAGIGDWTSRMASSSSKTSCFTFQKHRFCLSKYATCEGKTSCFTSLEYRPSISKSYTLLSFLPLQLPSTDLTSWSSLSPWFRSKDMPLLINSSTLFKIWTARFCSGMI